ncbi:MAG: alpha amylase C-terminal domain-containing protein, partial [Lachnospiraceae bacterium]|nr:alpha amylase C-terminal domain-containing protein [Lachnospiraceae bacterium]
WISCEDSTRSIYSFFRTDSHSSHHLLFVCNFSSVAYNDFRVGVPCPGQYELILDENGMCLAAASDSQMASLITAEPIPWDGFVYSLAHPLSAYGIQVYRFDHSRH